MKEEEVPTLFSPNVAKFFNTRPIFGMILTLIFITWLTYKLGMGVLVVAIVLWALNECDFSRK